MTGTSRGRPWTANDEAKLRTLWSQGLSLSQIAIQLDRPFGSVQTKTSLLRLVRAKLVPAIRDRIGELHSEGWTSKRISMKTGIDPVAIDEILRRAGREPNKLTSQRFGS